MCKSLGWWKVYLRWEPVIHPHGQERKLTLLPGAAGASRKSKKPREREIILFKQATGVKMFSGIPHTSLPVIFYPLLPETLQQCCSHLPALTYRWHEATGPQLLCCWHVTKAPHISTSAPLVHWASSVQLFPGGSADHCQIRKLLSALQPERLQGKEFHLWKVWFYCQGYISPSESLRIKKSFLMFEEGSKISSFNFLQNIYANCTERYNWKYTARKMYLGKMYSRISGISNRFGRWQDGISLQMTTR